MSTAMAARELLRLPETSARARSERTPRGGTRWHRSSVRHLLAKAEGLDRMR